MNSRDSKLPKLRPNILSAKINDRMSEDERFQNETIRPIVKLQNELLLEVFRNYIHKHKGVFFTLTAEKQIAYIENAVQRDIKFRNSLKGMLIGQFTVKEYLKYIKNSSALNKRMMNIVIQRLQSQNQLFASEKKLAEL